MGNFFASFDFNNETKIQGLTMGYFYCGEYVIELVNKLRLNRCIFM